MEKYIHDLVSIIIPVHNNLKYTKQCLNTLFNHTISFYELIIIDNNSTDDTLIELEEFKSKTQFYPYCLGFTIIKNNKNLSFSKANNHAENYARGEFLVFLNNDTLPTNYWLSELKKTYYTHDNTAIVGSKLLYEDDTIQHCGVIFINEIMDVEHIFKHSHKDAPWVNIEREYNAVTAACMLINHSVFNQVGKFDEKYINNFEDIDLCFKIKEKGYKIFYSPNSIVYHYESKTIGRKKYIYETSDYFFEKWSKYKHKLPQSFIDDKKYFQLAGFNLNFSRENNKFEISDSKFSKEQIVLEVNRLFDLKEYQNLLDFFKRFYLINPEKWDDFIYLILAMSYEEIANEKKIPLSERQFCFEYQKSLFFYEKSVLSLGQNNEIAIKALLSFWQRNPKIYRNYSIFKTNSKLSKTSKDLISLFHKNNNKYITNLASIIIPVFNNLSYTKDAIDSIFLKTKTDYEIIIVNNNSTDGTDKYLVDLEKNKTKYSIYCKNIKIINNSENKSFSISNNQASNIAEGEFLVFLNNDTSVTDFWLSNFKRTIFDDYSIGIVGAKLIYEDHTIQHCGVGFSSTNSIEHYFQGFNLTFPYSNIKRETTAVTAACMLIRTDLFIELGKFDTSYINCFEDTDLCFKAKELGYKIVYNPDILVFHYESKTSGRKNNEQTAGNLFSYKWAKKISPDIFDIYRNAGFVVENNIIDLPKTPELAIPEAKLYLDQEKYIKALNGIIPIYLIAPNEKIISDLYNQIVEKMNRKPSIKTGKYTENLASIIIPVFNNLSYTKTAIEKIFENTATDYELIVINNNSTDGTKKYLINLKNKQNYPVNCKKIQIIHNNNNNRFSKANNQGAAIAKGEFLTLLNNDTKVSKNWLLSMKNTFRKHDKCGIVGSRLIYDDFTIQHGGVLFLDGDVNIPPFHFMQNADFNHPAVLEEREFNAVTAACMLIKHEIFDSIGGFDEEYYNCFEDVDLCLRVKQSGYLIFYTPDSVVVHYESKTPGRKDNVALSADILRKKWKGKVPNDAGALYSKYNLTVKKGEKTINIDFADQISLERLKIAETKFYDKDYIAVIELLYPIYLLSPAIAMPSIHIMLAISFENTCNIQKASEVFKYLLKKENINENYRKIAVTFLEKYRII